MVSSPKHRPLALPVEIGGAGTTRVQVELQPGAQVRGTVPGSAAPLGNALVTLVDAAGTVVATTGRTPSATSTAAPARSSRRGIRHGRPR
ncbi:hypothetical protein [Streptomyces sp. NPDC005374]|uniref:hypothetical protein n=1 Tax=Streptomyces sp. NPDC005374 TaxID=3364713 RepID=UPI0036839497